LHLEFYFTTSLVANVEETSSSQNPLLSNDLNIERPVGDLVIRLPKGELHHRVHNIFARATQNYSIVEDMAQAPSNMLALEVLQTCSVQRKALLSKIGGVDPQDSMLAIFNMDKCKSPLSH